MATVFSKIIAGEIPGHFVWQDPQAVAIMTIAPIREGHILVIPRQEVDHWDDLEASLLGHLTQVSQTIAKGLKKTYPARRVGMMIAGLEVPHTHIHLVPMDSMGDLNFDRASEAGAEELKAAAERIREVLLEQGHKEANLA